ncbi:hypothetical protein [Methylobacterium sp. J-077]|uniref:hypothetical protein n=1 Tax=Methylobacterium sp. J-077 TaxID=2836656 RepID=UPI001FBB0321|nr:hypothetical protein [Methylobacterium sp. J-077]MCJ2123192.1 hypothetical protein [Methylobacterium sp. J-077]
MTVVTESWPPSRIFRSQVGTDGWACRNDIGNEAHRPHGFAKTLSHHRESQGLRRIGSPCIDMSSTQDQPLIATVNEDFMTDFTNGSLTDQQASDILLVRYGNFVINITTQVSMFPIFGHFMLIKIYILSERPISWAVEKNSDD